MATPADRIAACLEPSIQERLADYLESVRGPAFSELRLHHGLGGRVTGAEAWLKTKALDAPPKNGASSGPVGR